MSDDRLEEIKAKMKAADQAKLAKQAEENQARQRILEKKREVAQLFNAKVGIFNNVIDNLNREFQDTGHQLVHSVQDGSEFGEELQTRTVALRPLRVNDNGMDKMSITFRDMGSVDMVFGTKKLRPAGSDQCTLEEFDADRLRGWIFDFIDKNVPDV